MPPNEEVSAQRTGPVPGARSVLLCLAWTLTSGVLVGGKSVAPALGERSLPMQVLQPWHALGAMALLVGGVATLGGLAMRRAGRPSSLLERTITPATLLLLAGGGAAIALGQGSGLEYMVWPRGMTGAPLGLLLLVAWCAWRRLDALCRVSAEGAWLLVMGATLAPLGMLERLFGSETVQPTRALMIEWHALDTVFAGLNTSLYGLGILCTAPLGAGRPLRSRWLFAIAALALLSTFGHHHYGSGQPALLKWIALAGSLLGIVSFARHLAMLRRRRPGPGVVTTADPLARAAGAWTLFAVGSGVMLAIPPINNVVHGTHAIVAHSMGAIIGVNVAIVLSCLLSGEPWTTSSRLRRAAWSMQIALAIIVLDLGVAGIAKGLGQSRGSFRDVQPVVRAALLPLPLLGIWLSAAMARLGRVAWNAAPPAPGSAECGEESGGVVGAEA